MGRFKLQGGLVLLPELVALTLALSIYTPRSSPRSCGPAFSRSAMARSRQRTRLGSSTATRCGSWSSRRRCRDHPPLTSQYLNLTKNSSLAVAIGYPDFVNVFTGIVLNQTGQAGRSDPP